MPKTPKTTRRHRRPAPQVATWPDGQVVCDCGKPGCGNSVPGRARLRAANNTRPSDTGLTAPRP
jgi:hypothetical protein